MMFVKRPTQIGIKLPLGLRIWLESKAGEQKIGTSTFVRRLIEAEALRDLQAVEERRDDS